ncbi:MAG: trypsin-like peptidase domain-containing protein [Actinomycetota bacterium]|nr:trypsin-like peptidase domain-containing protein [Actinomycetota bacterium]
MAAVLAGALSGGTVAAVATRGSATRSGSATPTSVTRSTGTVAASNLQAGTAEAAAKAVGPSVVTIAVTGRVQSAFGRAQAQSDTGSGVVIRTDGYVLTNNHVVAAAVGGGTVSVTFSDGRSVPASIVGTDPTSDLAVVRVSGVTGLTAAVFADSDQLHVGQAVLAVGAPLGLSNTVTEGIVSTLHRPVATGEQGAPAQSVIDAVQTDAAINPGNSGGALVDLAGRVVGINSAIASVGASATGTQSGNIGVGFAIPSSAAAKVADQLIATGHATHAQLGVSVTDGTGSSANAPGAGATLGQVAAGGPAAAAGLQAGDVVTKVGDRVVTDANGLIVAVRAHEPGESVVVTYRRSGAVRTASVVLAASVPN